jgi:glycosyltransferase involved in cell wall biosynthesis
VTEGDMGPPREKMRLGIVVPRYGRDLWGGAELHGRWLAQRLAGAGHAVDVLTTCANNHWTWANDLPAGEESDGRVRVLRFPTTDRDLGIHGELDRALFVGFTLSRDEELLWLRHGGSSEAMEDYLRVHADDYDAVLALPYLFGTTYHAFAACPSKTVLIPCLHDEAFAYMGFVKEMLSGAAGLLFNTDAEASLAKRICPNLAPWGVVGVGLDLPDRSVFRPPAGPPSILYVGRREGGKKSHVLTDYFMQYKSRKRSDLLLKFAGSGDPVPKRRDIVEWDRALESGPFEVFGGATIVCQPSINESLSIVLLEGWGAMRPALVNGACEVTRQHCERSNGGLWFSSYAEFEETVDRLIASPELAETLGRNGRAYVERQYSWEAVLDRFHRAMERVLESQASISAGA